MSKTIEGIPEFITHDQYLGLFAACGIDPEVVVELRMAGDGVHVLVFALDENGRHIVEMPSTGAPAYQKHRIFIPVRREPDDQRTARVTDVATSRSLRDPSNARGF
jgi:hypothetical protein